MFQRLKVWWNTRLLRSKSLKTKHRALEGLRKLGACGVAPLIAALHSSDQSVRDGAAKALGQLDDPSAVELLIAALKNVQRMERFDSNITTRIVAANALGQIGDPRAVEPLIAALMDSDYAVRKSAADALKMLGGSSANAVLHIFDMIEKHDFAGCVQAGAVALEPLVATFQDKRNNVQYAARALAQLGDARAVSPLIAALHSHDQGPLATESRVAAGDALVGLGACAVAPLIDELKHPSWNVRSHTAKLLGRLGDVRAFEPLSDALSDAESWVRDEAAEALGRLRDARAFEPLLAMLQDSCPRGQSVAARALGQLGDARAVNPLIAALKCTPRSVRSVRSAAAGALGYLGDARAFEPLIAALKDDDRSVRCVAAEALGKLGVARAFEPLIAFLGAGNDRDTQRSVADAVMTLLQSDTEGTISRAQLHAVVGLADIDVVFYDRVYKDSCGNFSCECRPDKLDLSDLRQLARQNLIRREAGAIDTAPGATTSRPERRTIQVTCSHCTKKFKTAAKHAGRQLRCPKCQTPIIIPMN